MKQEIRERIEKIRKGEVPEGYKETKVGIIPGEWKIKTFENIAEKKVKWSITGGPFGSNLKASEYTSDGVRIIQLQNIGDGVFNDDYKIYTSEEKANELLSCNIYPNEIILSKMGDPVARACFVPNTGMRFLMSSDGIRLVVDESRFSKKFIHDYINSIYFRKRAFDASIGSTRLRIGLQDLKKLLVIAPPLPEQQKIADILSTWNNAIDLKEKLIKEKKEFKRGVMQKLLTGDLRFLGFTDEWEVKKLGDLVDKFVNGGTPSTQVSDYWNGEIPWITGADILNQKVAVIRRYISIEAVKNSSTNIIEKNNLLLVSRTGVGKLAITPFDVAISQDFTGIYTKKAELDTDYLFIYLDFAQKELTKQNQGTSIQGITRETLASIPIPLPPNDEQHKIVEIIRLIDNNIELLKSELAQLQEQKRGLMQLLLTGIVRVEVN